MHKSLHLRYIVAAAEHRSIRREVVARNGVRPALSKRVREREDLFDV